MCEQALRKYPPTSGNKKELASVARLLGLTRLLQHRDSEAPEGLRKAVAWYPQDADTHFRYGVTLARLDNETGGPLLRQAVSEYQRSLAIDPNQGRVWYYLGFADMRLGDKQSAIAAFQKAKDLGYKEAEETLTKLGV
jgi:tetratricopeptide (TPR) repeat protein